MIDMYANIDERNTAIETIKQECRDLIAEVEAFVGPGRLAAMPVWMDGVWGDYWYMRLDGKDIGDILYDGFGPVVKGDALGTLVYRAGRATELRAERSA